MSLSKIFLLNLSLIILASFCLFVPSGMAEDSSGSSGFFGFFDSYNGFDLSKHSIPKDKILSGGPPRDGIPSINNPKFLKAEEADFMKEDDLILGISLNGVTKAYPIKILNWHEVVNDKVGERPIVVSFCPLCGTGMVFDPIIEGKRYTFGVSGLLYQSDLLMFDRQTESLWSQIDAEAVTGKMLGKRLKHIPAIHMTWKSWKKENPKALVLSTDTGFRRDYDRDPYQGYELSERIFFPVDKVDNRFHPKEKILGVEVEGVFKAYPFTFLAKADRPIKDIIKGKRLEIFFDPESQKAYVTNEKGEIIPSLVAFWFAWYAFHQDTLVYSP